MALPTTYHLPITEPPPQPLVGAHHDLAQVAPDEVDEGLSHQQRRRVAEELRDQVVSSLLDVRRLDL